MTGNRDADIRRICDEALDRPHAARDRYVTEACAGDTDLRREIEALLAREASADDFLAERAFDIEARHIAIADAAVRRVLVGRTLSHYRIDSQLGAGGMGVVYKAFDTRLERPVALKLIAPAAAPGADGQRRFAREARAASALNHPNIVSVYDVDEHDGVSFLVMELVDGQPLDALIPDRGLPLERALDSAAQIVAALEAAHNAGIIHRDIKPANIVVSASGRVKILDFGLAKSIGPAAAPHGAATSVTETGIVVGTVAYMSPEQAQGLAVDARSDVFSFGAVMYEMLTGVRAFQGRTSLATLTALLNVAPTPLTTLRPDVPSSLVQLVDACLQKRADARPSASDVLRSLTAAHQDDAAAHRSPASGATNPHGRRRNFVRFAAALMLLLGATWILSDRARTTTVTPAGQAVAILPFRSLPAAAGSELLEVGLADVLIGRLSQLPNVRMIPLTSSEPLGNADPLDAGRRLGATAVLAGTLEHDRGSVRALVRLVDVAADRVLWSATIDAEGDSLFAVQDAIVTRVVDELGPRLSAVERSRIVRPPTSSHEAFDAYLQGRAFFARGKSRDFNRAIDAFRRALVIDPGYADAWAALALAYRTLPLASDGRPRDAFPEASRAAARALAIDPDNADAHVARGSTAFWWDWNWRDAEREFRRAIGLQPNSGVAHLYLGHLLSNIGRGDEAVAEARRARALDPGWQSPAPLEGQFLFFARRYTDAVSTLDSVLEMEPGMWQAHLMRAYPLIELNRAADAILECDRAFDLSGGLSYSLALRGYALGRLGRSADAHAVLRRLETMSQQRYVPPHHLALVTYALGDVTKTLAHLRSAVTERDVYVTFLGTDPKWDGLRSAPEFQQILARAQLLDVSNRVAAATHVP